MATKRKRASSWEFVVRRKGLLPKPLYLTFASEAEGDQYVRKLEALLERGVVPDEFRQRAGELITIEDAARAYLTRNTCLLRTNAALSSSSSASGRRD